MILDALHLGVADIDGEPIAPLAELNGRLLEARQQALEIGLQETLRLLFRLNRSALTLLERQRALQSFSDEFRHYAKALSPQRPLPPLFLRLCAELAVGFKRLLLQIIQGRSPSRPHLAWCLYMALYFTAQCLLRHYQLYQEPAPELWRDSHLLYWIGEQQACLDEPVAAAFQPTPASTPGGLYQQVLLLALSNPFHLAEEECLLLFSALAPLATLPQIMPWAADDDGGAPLIDLTLAQPSLAPGQPGNGNPAYLRRLELGALLIAVNDPAPLRSGPEHHLLERVKHHWLGREQRRHPRTERAADCNLLIGLQAIHAHLLEQRPVQCAARLVDSSACGARLLCPSGLGNQFPVGQLVLLLDGAPNLVMVRWRHLNAEGLHLGLHAMQGLPRPVWLRRTPSGQTHPGVLQSTASENGWEHGLWLARDAFAEGETLWLQLSGMHSQTEIQLSPANLGSTMVSRHPLKLR
ncbi:PilZ domain-containing protein [Pseudomonas kuykendallii]|uniref:PilZ domain-containing protein n=1 Tax=Pseudomonas kuykendallii TaxID=1007099 RepID=UPI0028D45CF8|nr:PilZ domain-containing protein [Pseudomonas kuykendallii]